MRGPALETFPSLENLEPEFRHGLTLRRDGVDVLADKATAVARLEPHFTECVRMLGFSRSDLVTAEQVHGADLAVVDSSVAEPVPGVDGLLSNRPGLLLGIQVADCCAVYLADRRQRAWGVVHSGKKGTELGIVPRAIARLEAEFGVAAADLRIQLSPCIRPPDYEIDFAAQIQEQCREAGVPDEEIHDSGVSTADNLERYYSYRIEKGSTGRMLALLGRRH